MKVRSYTAHSSSTTYGVGALVQKSITLSSGKTLNTIWKSLTSGNVGNTPSLTSGYWEREELCGKKLSSCKCGFQARMVSEDSSSVPQSAKDSSRVIPFGAFPGSHRF